MKKIMHYPTLNNLYGSKPHTKYWAVANRPSEQPQYIGSDSQEKCWFYHFCISLTSVVQ